MLHNSSDSVTCDEKSFFLYVLCINYLLDDLPIFSRYTNFNLTFIDDAISTLPSMIYAINQKCSKTCLLLIKCILIMRLGRDRIAMILFFTITIAAYNSNVSWLYRAFLKVTAIVKFHATILLLGKLFEFGFLNTWNTNYVLRKFF